ncbi:MAG: F0F1 ATP synthase subunit A [Clostridia bacterium]|nr:F0F1 ATP synthase subunit A [Clostridia bacterium]
MQTKTVIEAAVGAVVFAACLVGFLFMKGKLKETETPDKKLAKRKKLFFIGMIIGAWFMGGVLLTAFSGMKPGGLHINFEMFSPRVTLPFGNLTLAKTTVTAVIVTALLVILLALFRLICVPKFTDGEPKGMQNAAEIAVEFMDGFVEKATEGNFISLLSPFMLCMALFMAGCAFSELVGARAPTSDLTCTLALGLCTFTLINVCGIRKNGIGGRLKNMGGAMPAMRPVMIPLKAVSDIAVPVSLGCRLFGNMLGGLMVMDLLKGVLGGYASGLPAIAGLYFNLFHPGIQIYIFITLSLTFINEALEMPETT